MISPASISQFRDKVDELLQKLKSERERPPSTFVPMSSGSSLPLENSTRLYFLDNLFEALGWKLSFGGSLTGEVRIKDGTTNFIDYVGLSSKNDPLMIIEAKRWGLPFVSPKDVQSTPTGETSVELIARTIMHIRGGGAKADAPVNGDWFDHIYQVAGYVKNIKRVHGHEVRKVVLTTGEWIVIISDAAEVFTGTNLVRPDQITHVHSDRYVQEAVRMLELISADSLRGDIPKEIRPTQISTYIDTSAPPILFHGLLVKYESTGHSRFRVSPRLLLYPAIFFEAGSENVLAVIKDARDGVVLSGADLGSHVSEIQQLASELLDECQTEVGTPLKPSAISRFAGFYNDGVQMRGDGRWFIEWTDQKDEWRLVTGTEHHYLQAGHSLEGCKFHSWSNCVAANCSADARAISTPSVKEPKTFFTDGATSFCGNQEIIDRRHERCHIDVFDQRTCCHSCVFLDQCWTGDRRARMPCTN